MELFLFKCICTYIYLFYNSYYGLMGLGLNLSFFLIFFFSLSHLFPFHVHKDMMMKGGGIIVSAAQQWI